MSNSLWLRGLQHASLPCPSLSSGVCSNTCSLSRWCHPPSHCLCSLLLLPSISPRIRVFSSESTLSIRRSKYWNFSFSISPFNEYSGLISLGLTGLISLLSKGLSRVFSSTTIRKHQLFSTQSSLWPNLNTYLIEIILKLFNHNLSPHSFFLQNQHKYIWLFLNLILDSLLWWLNLSKS